MYEIIDNKVVKREVSESIVDASSKDISEQIQSVKETIESLGKTLIILESDLVEVLNLEKLIKQ
jgi:hypothetical protein